MSTIQRVNNTLLSPLNQSENCNSKIHCDMVPFEEGHLSTAGPRHSEVAILSNLSNYDVQKLKDKKRYKSKLELIDDTKLTSLPIPPPPRPKKVKSVGSFKGQDINKMRELSLDTDCDYDGSVDESDDPFVFVEDYIHAAFQPGSFSREIDRRQLLFKKKSLASFKKRIQGNLFTSSTSEGTSRIDTYPADLSTNSDCESFNESLFYAGNDKEENDIKEVFGNIPGSERLKHCEMCEKPLYEISSVINHYRNQRAESDNPPFKDTNGSGSCTEFVCWDCIDIYDGFLNSIELMNTLLANSLDTSSGVSISSRNCQKSGISGSLLKYAPLYQRKEFAFSPELISRLHELKDGSLPKFFITLKDHRWVVFIRNKIRWRWRLKSFVPRPFNS